MKNSKFLVPVIIVLAVAIISLGIAFAAFSTTLNINGSATVESSTWEIVYEGKTDVNSILTNGKETVLTGSASEVTHPTIKNNATEVSTYSVVLRTPGDSVTYNFKVHNKGDYNANISSLTIAGVSNPNSSVSGSNLVKNQTMASQNASTLNKVTYTFYYTDDNTLVGQNPSRDCLEADESENISLRIAYSTTSETDVSVLPEQDIVIDNLGITTIYTQVTSCSSGISGGSGGNTSPQNDPTVTASTSGGGTSNQNPTVNNNTISGARVTVPNSGDKVTYSINYTFDDCTEINSVTLPTHEEIVAANPGIDSNALNNLTIAVTNSEGNSVNGMQFEANTPSTLKVVVENTGANLTGQVIIPDLYISFVEECNSNPNSSSSGTQYLLSYIYNKKTKQYEETWTNDLDDLATHTNNNLTPNIYIKKVGNNVYDCVKLSSQEYCFTGYETPSDLQQKCSALGGTYETDVGSHGEIACGFGSGNSFYVEYYGREYDEEEGKCEFGQDGYSSDGWMSVNITSTSATSYLAKDGCENQIYYSYTYKK